MNRAAPHNMYFVAIVCPPEINDKVLQYKNWMRDRFGCIVALKSPAHITLVPPFWLEASNEEQLLRTLEQFAGNSTEVEIHLNGFSHFGNRVIFINVTNTPLLDELKRRTEDHFSQAFAGLIKKDERPFHPHVTIANRDLKPAAFDQAWEYFSRQEFVAIFNTKAIAILKAVDGKWLVVSGK